MMSVPSYLDQPCVIHVPSHLYQPRVVHIPPSCLSSNRSFHIPLECHMKVSINTDKLDQYLKKRKFETIIRDSNLFWLAYCKALQPNQKEENNNFFVSIKENHLHYSGKKGTLEKTENIIEKLRKFFERELINNKMFEIFAIKTSKHYFFKKNSSLDKIDTSKGYPQDWYHNFIKPALLQLTELCGALYAEDQKKDPIKIRIHRQEIPIPKRKKISKSSQNQKKSSYDLSLICKNASAIQVKSDLLYAYGGPVLQRILTSGMKESVDKTISFSEYSENTVQAFVEFICSGKLPHPLKIIDLIELFKLAHFYQLDPLIDSCTNLIALSVTEKNLKKIKNLLKTYDNEHLKQLCEHLALKKQLSKSLVKNCKAT